MSKMRRIQIQALAVLRRAKEAGIPEDFLRIKKDAFRSLLDEPYYKAKNQTADKVAHAIYDCPEKVLTKRFILIDGGDSAGFGRKKAGFGILFRMIACNKTGKYVQGKTMANILNSGYVSDGLTRSEYVDSLKDVDVLYIGELRPRDFHEKGLASTFIDELMEYRHANKLLTVISFSEYINGVSANLITNSVCGVFINQFLNSDMKELQEKMKDDFRAIRIRVK